LRQGFQAVQRAVVSIWAGADSHREIQVRHREDTWGWDKDTRQPGDNLSFGLAIRFVIIRSAKMDVGEIGKRGHRSRSSPGVTDSATSNGEKAEKTPPSLRETRRALRARLHEELIFRLGEPPFLTEFTKTANLRGRKLDDWTI